MKWIGKSVTVLMCVLLLLTLAVYSPSTAVAAKVDKKAKVTKADPSDKMGKVNAAFDVKKMGDMSDFDPANPVVPTGDTIKIAVVAAFSGPSAVNGRNFFALVQWAAHDINKRGGIWVDGKKKLVQVLKADHMSKADQCKKVTERMILQEKVQFLWGTDGSHMMKIINETANKYKVIAMNVLCMSDDLQDATNFSRYTFQVANSTEQTARAMAYYYGQIRKKEKKFYILNQDYGFGHEFAEDFKKGLKEYYPDAQVVGEDYHKLFLTDFAPYLEKIKASGAEVVLTGDWLPDAGNLRKQARQMGVNLPFLNIFMDDPLLLHDLGIEGSKGLVNINPYNTTNPFFKTPEQIKYYKIYNAQWKKWKTPPYNGRGYEHAAVMGVGHWAMNTYWLLSVIERAKSTDPEKIIQIWENDSYKFVNGKIVKMRACDHKVVQDLSVAGGYVPPAEQKGSFNIPPYYWYEGASFQGSLYKVPAEKILPKMDKKLDRCTGKNGWGE